MSLPQSEDQLGTIEPIDTRFGECSNPYCDGGQDYYGLCRYCGGSGIEEIETALIDLDDLEVITAAAFRTGE